MFWCPCETHLSESGDPQYHTECPFRVVYWLDMARTTPTSTGVIAANLRHERISGSADGVSAAVVPPAAGLDAWFEQ